MVRVAPKIAILLQGPLHTDTNGYSTRSLLESLSASPWRSNFYVASVLWEDESPAAAAVVREHVDEVILARKPSTHGAGNRDFLRTAVAAGLDALERGGFTHVLKSRHDFLLSERVLTDVIERAAAGYERIYTTNLFTKREAFHVSDMLLFSTFGNVKAWYDPREVYYQDLYSPEVQFARCFVRNKQLPYAFTQAGYLKFLRDWVELVDWTESGVVWFKEPTVSRTVVNWGNHIMRDRDCGALMCKLLPGGYPERLRGRSDLHIRTRALWQLVSDLVYTFWLVEVDRLFGRHVHTGPHYFEVPLPGSLVLDIKLGFQATRFDTFGADVYGDEAEKPIGREMTVDRRITARAARLAALDAAARTQRDGAAPADLFIHRFRGPFGLAIRRRRRERTAVRV